MGGKGSISDEQMMLLLKAIEQQNAKKAAPYNPHDPKFQQMEKQHYDEEDRRIPDEGPGGQYGI